ncbi:MAG TPA: hypothetical protein VEH84_07455 [Alphaproteobacteria bacterium]|nr:hypothetical protein [Alphaproteobacteria bacterium]
MTASLPLPAPRPAAPPAGAAVPAALLRASVFTIVLPSLGYRQKIEVVRAALGAAGPIGILAEGSLAFLHLGPAEAEPPAAVAQRLAARIATVLSRLSGEPKELCVLHRWSADIGDGERLLASVGWTDLDTAPPSRA